MCNGLLLRNVYFHNMRLFLFVAALSIATMRLLGEKPENKTSGDFVYRKNKSGLEVSLVNALPGSTILQSQTSLIVPDAIDGLPVTVIGNMQCRTATNITIPNTATNISAGAFAGCSNLISFTIPQGTTTIERGTFFLCKKLTSLNVPEGVISIGDSALEHCISLTNIILPSTLKTIGKLAFADCRGLKDIRLPDSLTCIGNTAFSKCTNLPGLTFPPNLRSIGANAFQFCGGLTNIDVQGSATSIGQGAFYLCTNLVSVTVSNALTTIQDKAFYKCTKLTNLTIPNGITKIDKGAFLLCTDLHVKALSSLIAPDNLAKFRDDQRTADVINRCVYTLAFAEEQSANPETIIDLAMKSNGISETPFGGFLKWGLLDNLRLAKEFGLTTPEGMVALREGKSAFITKGEYKGEAALAHTVIPKEFAPELANNIINLELGPSKLNTHKGEKVDKRQFTFARELHEAKIITDNELQSLEDSVK
jgi:hypothetical protein